MINNIVDVKDGELSSQIKYLKQSSVSQVGHAIENGLYKLQKGNITSRSFLGEMKTIFSELGGIFSQKEFGKEKFTVNEVWDILHRGNCTDANSLKSVEYLKRSLAQGFHDPKITILRTDEDMIIDGDKTATAFYNLDDSEEKINLDVYIASSNEN